MNVRLGTEYFKRLWGAFVGSSMVSTDPLSQLGFRRVANAIAAYYRRFRRSMASSAGTVSV